MAIKMFITGHLLKESVGNPETPECNYSSKNDSYIKSLIEQMHYLKEENEMENSFIQSLLFRNSSTTKSCKMIYFAIVIKLIFIYIFIHIFIYLSIYLFVYSLFKVDLHLDLKTSKDFLWH